MVEAAPPPPFLLQGPVTEEAIRYRVEQILETVRQDPTWLDEILRPMPEERIRRYKKFLLEQQPPFAVDFGWPETSPKAPVVVVVPGEGQESDQVIGSTAHEDTAEENYGITTSMTYLSSVHHINTYSANADTCMVVAKIVLWALVIQRWNLEGDGLVEQRVIEGPLEPAEEWLDSDWVWKRSVHLIHKWPLVHSDRILSVILRDVDVIANDPRPPDTEFPPLTGWNDSEGQ